MSVSSTPTGFTVEALLTRVIPGLLVISPFAFHTWMLIPSIYSNKTEVIFAVTLGGLIFGELIEHLRSGLFRVPFPFSYYMYTATDDDFHLPSWTIFFGNLDENMPSQLRIFKPIPKDRRLGERLQFNLLDNMESEFDLDPSKARARDYFDALLLYIGNAQNTRTRQYRNMYIFNQNLKMATIIALLFHAYYTFLQYPDPVYIIYVLSGITAIVPILVILVFLRASPYLYVEMLEKEFYIRNLPE